VNVRLETSRLSPLFPEHLRKCQSERSDSGDLLSVLASDRIHRITNLCMVADVDASQMGHEAKDVEDLRSAMQLL
jgi:hypothetical protein